MNDYVSAVSALANALAQGRTLQELLRLQVALQIVQSVINAQIAVLRFETQ